MCGWCGRFEAAIAACGVADSVRLAGDPVIPAFASLVLGYALRREADRWGAEAVLTAVAAKDRVDTSAGPLFEPPGYALIDLLVWAEPWDGVRINAGLFNLADRRVWDWSSARGINPTTDDLAFFTRPGRSASVSVTVGW